MPVALAIAVTLMSTIGQLDEHTYERFPELLGDATKAAQVEFLPENCRARQDDEIRLWLVGERGPVYLVRIQGPDWEGLYAGQFYSFHRGRIERLHETRAYDWAAVVRVLNDWESAEPSALGKGQRSFLSLVTESCREGIYRSETYWNMHDRPATEQKAIATIKGVLLGLDSPNPFPDAAVVEK